MNAWFSVSCPANLCGVSEMLFSFIAMGGYGVYVWGAYGLTALVLAVNIYLPKQRLSRLLGGRRQ